MGSGKSTVGKRLAYKLNLQFYDSDKIIEEREGLSITDIYEYKGETGEYSTVQGVPVVLPVTGASGTISDSVFYDYSFEPGFGGEHEFTVYWWVGYKVGHIALLPGGVESTI